MAAAAASASSSSIRSLDFREEPNSIGSDVTPLADLSQAEIDKQAKRVVTGYNRIKPEPRVLPPVLAALLKGARIDIGKKYTGLPVDFLTIDPNSNANDPSIVSLLRHATKRTVGISIYAQALMVHHETYNHQHLAQQFHLPPLPRMHQTRFYYLMTPPQFACWIFEHKNEIWHPSIDSGDLVDPSADDAKVDRATFMRNMVALSSSSSPPGPASSHIPPVCVTPGCRISVNVWFPSSLKRTNPVPPTEVVKQDVMNLRYWIRTGQVRAGEAHHTTNYVTIDIVPWPAGALPRGDPLPGRAIGQPLVFPIKEPHQSKGFLPPGRGQKGRLEIQVALSVSPNGDVVSSIIVPIEPDASLPVASASSASSGSAVPHTNPSVTTAPVPTIADSHQDGSSSSSATASITEGAIVVPLQKTVARLPGGHTSDNLGPAYSHATFGVENVSPQSEDPEEIDQSNPHDVNHHVALHPVLRVQPRMHKCYDGEMERVDLPSIPTMFVRSRALALFPPAESAVDQLYTEWNSNQMYMCYMLNHARALCEPYARLPVSKDLETQSFKDRPLTEDGLVRQQFHVRCASCRSRVQTVQQKLPKMNLSSSTTGASSDPSSVSAPAAAAIKSDETPVVSSSSSASDSTSTASLFPPLIYDVLKPGSFRLVDGRWNRLSEYHRIEAIRECIYRMLLEIAIQRWQKNPEHQSKVKTFEMPEAGRTFSLQSVYRYLARILRAREDVRLVDFLLTHWLPLIHFPDYSQSQFQQRYVPVLYARGFHPTYMPSLPPVPWIEPDAKEDLLTGCLLTNRVQKRLGAVPTYTLVLLSAFLTPRDLYLSFHRVSKTLYRDLHRDRELIARLASVSRFGGERLKMNTICSTIDEARRSELEIALKKSSLCALEPEESLTFTDSMTLPYLRSWVRYLQYLIHLRHVITATQLKSQDTTSSAGLDPYRHLNLPLCGGQRRAIEQLYQLLFTKPEPQPSRMHPPNPFEAAHVPRNRHILFPLPSLQSHLPSLAPSELSGRYESLELEGHDHERLMLDRITLDGELIIEAAALPVRLPNRQSRCLIRPGDLTRIMHRLGVSGLLLPPHVAQVLLHICPFVGEMIQRVDNRSFFASSEPFSFNHTAWQWYRTRSDLEKQLDIMAQKAIIQKRKQRRQAEATGHAAQLQLLDRDRRQMLQSLEEAARSSLGVDVVPLAMSQVPTVPPIAAKNVTETSSGEGCLEILSTPLHEMTPMEVDRHFDGLQRALSEQSIQSLVLRACDMNEDHLIRFIQLLCQHKSVPSLHSSTSSSASPSSTERIGSNLHSLTLLLPIPALNLSRGRDSAEVAAAQSESAFDEWHQAHCRRTLLQRQWFDGCETWQRHEQNLAQLRSHLDAAEAGLRSIAEEEGIPDGATPSPKYLAAQEVQTTRRANVEHARTVAFYTSLCVLRDTMMDCGYQQRQHFVRTEPFPPLLSTMPAPIPAFHAIVPAEPIVPPVQQLPAVHPPPAGDGPVPAALSSAPSSSSSASTESTSTVTSTIPSETFISKQEEEDSKTSPAALGTEGEGIQLLSSPVPQSTSDLAPLTYDPTSDSSVSAFLRSHLDRFPEQVDDSISDLDVSWPRDILASEKIEVEGAIQAFKELQQQVKGMKKDAATRQETCIVDDNARADVDSKEFLSVPTISLADAFETLSSTLPLLRLRLVHEYFSTTSIVKVRKTPMSAANKIERNQRSEYFVPLEEDPNHSTTTAVSSSASSESSHVPVPAGTFGFVPPPPYISIADEETRRCALSGREFIHVDSVRTSGLARALFDRPTFSNMVQMDTIPIERIINNDPTLEVVNAPDSGWTQIEIRLLCVLMRSNRTVHVWDWCTPLQGFKLLYGSYTTAPANGLLPMFLHYTEENKSAQARMMEKLPPLMKEIITEQCAHERAAVHGRWIPFLLEREPTLEESLRLLPHDFFEGLETCRPTVSPGRFCAIYRTSQGHAPASHEIDAAPGWLVLELAETLARNTTLKRVVLDNLFTNSKIRRFDQELIKWQEKLGRPISCKINVRSTASSIVAPDLQCTNLNATSDPDPAALFDHFAKRILTIPRFRSAALGFQSLHTLASDMVALLPKCTPRDGAIIQPKLPIATLFAAPLIHTTPDVTPQEPTSLQHPLTLALLSHLRSLFRPYVDAALTMEVHVQSDADGAPSTDAIESPLLASPDVVSTTSVRRVQWPAELVDLVVTYL